jgi:hypothetical protein
MFKRILYLLMAAISGGLGMAIIFNAIILLGEDGPYLVMSMGISGALLIILVMLTFTFLDKFSED